MGNETPPGGFGSRIRPEPGKERAMFERFFFYGLFGIPALLFFVFAYLARQIKKRMNSGEIKTSTGALLITVCMIPAAFCGFFLILLIGVFTGIIPLM